MSRFVVEHSDEGHTGPGWYASLDEYPDEGTFWFDHEPTETELVEAFGEDEP